MIVVKTFLLKYNPFNVDSWYPIFHILTAFIFKYVVHVVQHIGVCMFYEMNGMCCRHTWYYNGY